MSAGEGLVLLHGWGTHPVIWEPLLEYLPGARVLPLPGYAGSEATADFGGMVESLADQIDEGSVLVGWSLGALVAMRMAHEYPGKVSHLVLIGSTPCFVNQGSWSNGVDAEVFDQFARSLEAGYADTIRRFLALQAHGSSSVRVVLTQLRRRLLDQPRPPAGVLESGLEILQTVDLRNMVGKLNVPVTLIHGTGDKLAPMAAANWLASAIPDVALHEVHGAGHAPFLSHTEDVAKMIAGAVRG